MQLLACDVSGGGGPRSSMMSPGSLPRPRGALRGWDRAPGRGSILGPKPEPPSLRLRQAQLWAYLSPASRERSPLLGRPRLSRPGRQCGPPRERSSAGGGLN